MGILGVSEEQANTSRGERHDDRAAGSTSRAETGRRRVALVANMVLAHARAHSSAAAGTRTRPQVGVLCVMCFCFALLISFS